MGILEGGVRTAYFYSAGGGNMAHAVLVFRRFVGGACIGLGGLLTLGNLLLILRWWVWKARFSLGPIMGGSLGMIGVLLLPLGELRPFWWVPPLLDIGCVPLLLCTGIDVVRHWIGRNSDMDARK